MTASGDESQPTILVLAGSLRAASFNRRLARYAADRLAEMVATVGEIDMREYPLPPYDGDLDGENRPADVFELMRRFREADGYLIAMPEYNGSMPGPLKNLLDWVSRSSQEHPTNASFRDKIAAICSTSPGRNGGIRGMRHLRDTLSDMGSWVVPRLVAIPEARTVFDELTLTDEAKQAAMEKLLDDLYRLSLASRDR